MSEKAPLLEPASRYQFFQAVRLLESALSDGPALGERGPYEKERLRLRPSTSLGFPTSEVVDITTHTEQDGTPRAVVTTNLPGLYGAGSPLPRSYAHQILLEEEEQPQVRALLDLLHHRLLSLWYRSWKHFRYEQAYQEGGRDLLSLALLDLIGISPATPSEEIGTEPVRLLRYLGLLLLRTRPVRGLEILLRDELELPITLEEAPVRELVLPQEQWFRLSAQPQSGDGCLGQDIVIGARRIDRQSQLRIKIGPVSDSTLRMLLPGGSLNKRLIALCRFYLRQPLDLSLHILVPAHEVARVRIGGAAPSQLGGPMVLGQPRQDPIVFAVDASLCRNAPLPRLFVVKAREVE